MKKHVFIVIPTFNEEENIQNLFDAIQTEIFKLKDKYRFSLLFIDNSSKDESITILRDLASKYKFVKVIINNKNYGHIRSPYYGILQSEGDATIYMASDFQDPPELINKLIDKWEKGSEVVFCQKNKVSGNFLLEKIRSAYYKFLKKISGIEIVSDATGFGIYDKKVIDKIKEINDPLPFFRGLIVELGFKIDIIKFNQPNRNSGISKNNLYTLFDYAIHGMVSHSTLPLRLITLVSIPAAIISFVMALDRKSVV